MIHEAYLAFNFIFCCFVAHFFLFLYLENNNFSKRTNYHCQNNHLPPFPCPLQLSFLDVDAAGGGCWLLVVVACLKCLMIISDSKFASSLLLMLVGVCHTGTCIKGYLIQFSLVFFSVNACTVIWPFIYSVLSSFLKSVIVQITLYWCLYGYGHGYISYFGPIGVIICVIKRF